MAMVLLICAGLMIESFSMLRGLDPGFRPDHVLTLRAVLPRSTYREFPKRAAFVDGVLERVRALPGVKSVGIHQRAAAGVERRNQRILARRTHAGAR